MACGLTKTEAMKTPFGEIQDLAAIYQIKQEGAEFRPPAALARDEQIIPDIP